MTSLQQRVLRFIADFISERGHSPTYREIADGIGYRSKSGVNRVVLCLEREGYLARTPHRACSLKLTAKGIGADGSTISIPLDLRGRLERQAEREGVTPTSIALQAIAQHLEGRGS